jgi:hypothetical protein
MAEKTKFVIEADVAEVNGTQLFAVAGDTPEAALAAFRAGKSEYISSELEVYDLEPVTLSHVREAEPGDLPEETAKSILDEYESLVGKALAYLHNSGWEGPDDQLDLPSAKKSLCLDWFEALMTQQTIEVIREKE